MKKLLDVYNDAENKNLPIIPVNFSNKKAGIIHYDNTTLICADYHKFNDRKEEKIAVAEEIAHYDVGAYYHFDSDFIEIAKAEYKAKKHLYNALIPYAELLAKTKEYNGNIEELSDYFGVPEEDIKIAFFCYTNIENYSVNA